MAIPQPLTGRTGRTSTRAATATQERRLRLGIASAVGVALILFLLGTAWDIQWHPAVGRDRALTLPHVLMLGGIFSSGVLSLALVLIDSWRRRAGHVVTADNSLRILGIFAAPLGAVVAGLGALLGAIAFPLDDYWHTLYGIDVTLWAPFHVMILGSMMLTTLGLLYLLTSELNRTAVERAKLPLQLGVAGTAALLLAITLLFIPQASVAEGLASAGSYQFVLWPVLFAAILPLGLLTPLLATRRPGTAIVTALTLMALRQLMYWLIPWAMDLGVASEGLSYRPNAPTNIIVPVNYPSWILLGALLLDGLAWLQRRRDGWRPAALGLASAGAAVMLTFLDQPWATIITYYYPGLDTSRMFWNALPLTVVAGLLGAGLALTLGRSLTRNRQ